MKTILKLIDKEIMTTLSKYENHIPIYVGDELVDVVKRG